MEETDADLVGRVRQGDRGAADRLLGRYLRACWAVALAVTGSEADADDVCQDAFVAAMARVDECRDPARFGGWLLGIVRNRARNVLRHHHVRRADALGDDTPATQPSPAAELERLELRSQLEDALSQLTETQREVVLLHDLEGWKHTEIAERLELQPGTVRSHLHNARHRLRRMLRKGEVEE